MARADDPRPAKTRATILAAVERLSRTAEEVSVRAIVAEAGISRSTFYTQFRDLDDLAVSVLGDAFVAIRALDLELRTTRNPFDTAQATTRRLVEEFAEHRDLYAAVLGGRTTAEAHRAVQADFAAHAVDTMRRAAPANVDPDTAAIYVAAGSLAVISAWLTNDDPGSIDHLQTQLLALLPTWLNERDQPDERKTP